MRSYQAARGYFSFLSFVSWAAILGGAGLGLLLAAAVAETSRFGNPTLAAFLASTPGLILAAVGLFGLIFVQSSRAAVDSAEYAQQALAVSRNQLEVSRQLLKLAEKSHPAIGYQTTAAELKNVSFDTSAPAASQNQGEPGLRNTKADEIELAGDTKALPDLSEHISYTDGRYLVGEKRFWSRTEAEDHVRSQLLAPQA